MSEQTGGAESTSEDAVLRYDRDDMMRIMMLPISCTRPAYLSEDFNGDDGKFSPYKWLEHKWETDPPHGKRTQVQKLVDNVREEDERPGAVLSPQRRGFSSGCKPQDELANEEEWQDPRSRGSNRLGGGLKNWRGGASGGGNTAAATNGKGPQQNAKPGAWKGKEGPADQNRGGRFNQNNGNGQSGSWGSTGSSWRTAGDDRNNRNNRDQRGQMRGNNRGPHEEKLPEWADDGPASVNDLIELRGFDEPKRNRNKDKKDGKDSKEKSADTKKDQKSGSKKDKESTSRPDSRENAGGAPVHIPDSDAEFAAIMGLIDKDGMNNISKPAVPDENVPTTGSRLSRFFNKGRSEDKGAGQSTGVDSSEPAPGGSAVFAKLFGNKNVGSSQTGSTGNSTPLPAMPMMRLEDVENQMRTQNQQQPRMPPVQVSHAATVQRAPEASRAQETGKGNPLQDPQEQALLMQKLSRFQRQQEGPMDGQIVHMPAGQNSQGGSPPPPPPGPTQGGAPYMMPPGNGPIPPPAQVLARLADPQFAAAIINANYTKAMMEASAACGGGQVPAHIQESIKQAAVQSLLHQRQQMMVLAQLGKLPGMPGAGMPGMPNGPQQQAPAQQSRATSLIPASVQRAMSKNAANQQPRQHTPDFESEEAAMAAAAGQKEQMAKKLAMQQQYAAMMSAMQGGLSMAAWRPPPPQSGGSQPQQPQANQQQQPTPAQMAQMQQLAQLARHQQMLAAAAAAQQQQQQAQRMHAAQQQHKYRDEASWQSGVSEGGASLQNPLEKLLASAGARPMVYHGEESAPSDPAPSMRLPDHARPISLEELERRFTESK